ncbi:MAG: endo-1,4-beta-xylanase [Dysgonamonadaceae bacterium]|jgi:endo-1,4-beta-xylanase|nr:endo-1,4-beta-xylanase [Dysgonamonadaceae bacterium]
MKSKIICICAAALTLFSCGQKTSKTDTLKAALADKFLIGAALNLDQIYERDTVGVRVINEQFSAIVPENCMKSMFLQPKQGRFFWDDADKFVEFGEKNGKTVTGHCLVWHSQAPAWLFSDENGNDVSRDTLLARMKNHITTVVSRYKGRIKGWDVVNEAILDNGQWRESKFYTIIGKDFIDSAFVYAHDADPDAELYYNDYNMAFEGKRKAVINLVESLKNNKLRIDGIGMQGHIGMDYPSIAEFEKSILSYSAVGVNVMITELDLTVLPNPENIAGADVSQSSQYQEKMNPYPNGLPTDVDVAWTVRYNEFFKLFLKHRDKISRVTLWGVSDADSWRNGWPVAGRTDYPLLFNRDHKPKEIVRLIIKEASKK